jgi:4'-phosphopantetheinyl transferase
LHAVKIMNLTSSFVKSSCDSVVLGQDDIDLWTVTLTEQQSDYVDDVQTLSADELARASRFKSDVERTSFVRRRVALRAILARYLGIPAREIVFNQTQFGKPLIPYEMSRGELFFNTSHSAGIAVIAVSRSVPLGIDVEQLRPIVEWESVASRFFTTSEAAALSLLCSSRRAEEFLRAWTVKEAVVKALGGGLSIPLNAFEISSRPGTPLEILRWDLVDVVPENLRIHRIDPGAGFVGALVTFKRTNVTMNRPGFRVDFLV